jgi:hypothetical protein
MREREQRLATNAPVAIENLTNLYQGVACDFSRNGACVFGIPRLPENSEVTLHCFGREIPGRVAWSQDMFTGVHFFAPLETVDFQAIAAISLASLKDVA